MFNHVATHKELRLFVSHDILLRKGYVSFKSQRLSHAVPGERPWLFRRWLNLLTPASVFFMAWAGIPINTEPHKILKYHPHSMRVL